MNRTEILKQGTQVVWAIIFTFLFLLLFAVIAEYSSRLDMLSLAENELRNLNEQRSEVLSSIRGKKPDDVDLKTRSSLRKLDLEIRKLNDYRKRISLLNTVGAPTRDFTLRNVIKFGSLDESPFPNFNALTPVLPPVPTKDDRESPMVIGQGTDGQIVFQPNPNQLPQIDTYDRLANTFRELYIDIPGMSLNSLTVILLFSCSWIGHIAVSFKSGRQLSFASTVYVSAIGLFLYLAVKGGGILLIANTDSKSLLFNPFGLALLSMFMGAYTEDAYRIFRNTFRSLSRENEEHG